MPLSQPPPKRKKGTAPQEHVRLLAPFGFRPFFFGSRSKSGGSSPRAWQCSIASRASRRSEAAEGGGNACDTSPTSLAFCAPGARQLRVARCRSDLSGSDRSERPTVLRFGELAALANHHSTSICLPKNAYCHTHKHYIYIYTDTYVYTNVYPTAR